MKNTLQFEFLADRVNNKITVRREFAADRQTVWNCYTRAELLNRWFAPKPFTTKTKSMDFKEGGHWHYAMVDPDGTEYWGWTDYTRISPIDFYETSDAFCDSSGTINPEMPAADWQVKFADKGANTLVETIVSYKSLDDLESILKMGMEEGLASTLDRLDELLVAM